MQKMRIVVMAVVVILSTGFCVLIIVSLIPYFSVIGLVATGVVFILLACISVLMVSFTWSRMGVWGKQRRLLVVGDVVVYVPKHGDLVHLSAIHEQAKVPPVAQVNKAIAGPKEPPADKETVLDLYSKGVSLRNIVEATGVKYHIVQKWTSEPAD